MPVTLRGGFPLIIMGAPSVEPCNCCCDFGLTVTYSTSGPATVLVLVASTAGRPTFTSCFVRIFRDGVLVVSVDNLTSSDLYGIAVSPGQTVTATVTATSNPACSFTQSCTRAGSIIQPTDCEFWDPGGAASGECWNVPQINAMKRASTTFRSATVSGLTGPMAALNGTYSASCASRGAGANISWSGGGYTHNWGSVGVNWGDEYSYVCEVSCLQSNNDACVMVGAVCNPNDTTRRRGFKRSAATGGLNTFTYRVRPATCAPCGFLNQLQYLTPGPLVNTQSSNGSPAESAVITWN